MTLHGALLELGPVALGLEVLAAVLLSAAATLSVSFLLRVRGRTNLPDGVGLLVGLGTVTLALNTRHLFVQFTGGDPEILSLGTAATHVVALVAAGVAAAAGNRLGQDLAESAWVQERSLDWSPLVRATGRFSTVTLPEDIEDVDGYEPVPEETKRDLAGETLIFPRGLTVDELEDQLVTRLRETEAIGYVDVEVSRDGAVRYLGLGHRPAGLGPTLPPASAAVAVRADPPLSATAGDAVQVWQGGPEPERLGTGELRAAVGDVATLALDEAVAASLDPREEHRLVTLPGDAHPERDFASTLRRADETMTEVAVASGSALEGRTLGAVGANVIAVRGSDGQVETIPSRDRTVAGGETLYVLGRPEVLRAIEEEAGAASHEAGEVLEEAREAVEPAPPDPDDGERP